MATHTSMTSPLRAPTSRGERVQAGAGEPPGHVARRRRGERNTRSDRPAACRLHRLAARAGRCRPPGRPGNRGFGSTLDARIIIIVLPATPMGGVEGAEHERPRHEECGFSLWPRCCSLRASPPHRSRTGTAATPRSATPTGTTRCRPYTRAEWEERAGFLRKQVLFSAGLWPLPEKTPLNPRSGERIVHDDYSVSAVLLETYPGFFLGGNLYRPAGKPGPFPAVVSPHGHWRLRPLRELGDQLRAGAGHQPGAPGPRRLRPRHGRLERHATGAARLREPRASSSGSSARSACSCGTASGSSTT